MCLFFTGFFGAFSVFCPGFNMLLEGLGVVLH